MFQLTRIIVRRYSHQARFVEVVGCFWPGSGEAHERILCLADSLLEGVQTAHAIQTAVYFSTGMRPVIENCTDEMRAG